MAKTKEASRLKRRRALKAIQNERISFFRAEMTKERILAARRDLDFIASTRENIISHSKKLRCSREVLAQAVKEAMVAYIETIIEEALRRPSKKISD